MSAESRREADLLLLAIGDAGHELAQIQAEYDRALASLKEVYREKLADPKTRKELLERDLKKLTKTQHAELFDGADRVDLAHGALLYSEREVVVKAKGVTVEALKELGYLDGIRVEEKLDWDEIETWPVERLTAIGTELKHKKDYAYELKEAAHVDENAA